MQNLASNPHLTQSMDPTRHTVTEPNKTQPDRTQLNLTRFNPTQRLFSADVQTKS